MPTIAYLGRGGFKDEFQENALVNGLMRKTLSKCIYVGPSGSSEEVNQNFICQKNLRPCRQMMRYARGYKRVETEFWESPRIKLFLNVVALQRDVLKERREVIRWDPQLMRDCKGELLEIRKQIQIIDVKWMGTRYREEVDVNSRPLISIDEWGVLTINGQITENWEQWNGKDPKDQWQVLDKAGMITQRPAPGAADEGTNSDGGGLGREGYFMSRTARGSVVSPVLPPSTGPRPKMPIDAMPLGGDPTSSGSSGNKKTQKIPERPAQAKPGPPEAPWIRQGAQSAKE